MVSVTARYLNGGHLTLGNCETVGCIMVQVALLHDRFASGVAVFCPDTYDDLTRSHSQVPPPEVSIVLKHQEDPPAKEDLTLALILHGGQEDTATCARVLEVLRQSYPEALTYIILVDLAENGAGVNWRALQTLLRIGMDGGAALCDCATVGDVNALRTLLSANVHPDAEGITADSALTCACNNGQKEIVNVMLSSAADINHFHKLRYTALSEASRSGNDEIIEILLSNAADVNLGATMDRTPLMCAAEAGRDKTMELLLRNNADVNQADKRGHTALTLASEKGHSKVVETLLSSGADVNHLDRVSRTALEVASRKGHDNVVKELLSRGADVNHRDQYGRTALTLASEKGYEKVVGTLLSSGAGVDHCDEHGLTALRIASWKGHDKVVEALLSSKAHVNYADKEGKTALSLASKQGHGKIAEMLQSYGARENHADKAGVFDSGCDGAMQVLSKSGEANQVNKLCGAALTQAATISDNKIAGLPSSNGDDVTYVDKSDDTNAALRRASETDRKKTAQNLLFNGDDVSQFGKNMDSPLAQDGVEDVARLADVKLPDKDDVNYLGRYVKKTRKHYCCCFFQKSGP